MTHKSLPITSECGHHIVDNHLSSKQSDVNQANRSLPKYQSYSIFHILQLSAVGNIIDLETDKEIPLLIDKSLIGISNLRQSLQSVCLLLLSAITTLFQLYHDSNMMYEIRRRKPEPTILLTQWIFNLPHHIGIV